MSAPLSRRGRNRRTSLVLGGVAVFMVGLSFAAVPLYQLFCQATGYNGTTQRANAAPGAVGARMVTVRFNAETASDLPWSFEPIVGSVKTHLGEETLVAYRATNKSAHTTTGTATFNVTPLKTGAYFNKLQCFCFTEQTLAPGQSVDMPVTFFVDPEMATDPTTREVETITLSYSMFRAKTDPKPMAARVPDDAPRSAPN